MADAYRGLTIRIGGDTTKLTAALRAANKAGAETQRQLKSIERAARIDPGQISNVTKQYGLLKDRAQEAALKLKTLKEAHEQLGRTTATGTEKSVKKLASETENASLNAQLALKRYNALNAELEKMYAPIDKAARKSQEFAEDFKLADVIRGTNEEFDTTVAKLKELGIVTDEDIDSIMEMRAALQQAFDENEAAKQVAEFKHLENEIEATTSQVNSLSSQMGRLEVPSRIAQGFKETDTQVERLDSSIEELVADAKRCDSALKLNPENTVALQRKMGDLAQATQLATEKAELLDTKLKAYKDAGIDDVARKTRNVTIEVQKTTDAWTEVNTKLQTAKASLQDAESRMKQVSQSANKNEEEYRQVADEVSKAKAEVRELSTAEKQAASARDSMKMAQEYEQLKTEASNAKLQIDELSTSLRTSGQEGGITASSMKTLFMSMSATVTPAVTMLGKATLDSAADMDSAYRDMRKTVNGTEQDFEDLKQSAIDFSNTNVTSASQILSIQAIGGELGVATDALDTFAQTVSNIDIATDLNAEDAATALGQLSNILDDLDEQHMPAFSDSIVRLGNNGASTETQIVDIAKRIGSMGSIVGMTTPDILAWASSIASTGQNAEAAGTAISNTMSDIETSVAKGGDDLKAFADVANMSAEDFANTWNTNPTAALKAFIEGLNDVESSGGSADATLEGLGITSVRQKQAIEGLMQTVGGLDDNLKMSSDAWNGVSDQWGQAGDAAIEAGKKAEGLSGSISRIKNAGENAASALGDALAPVVSDIADVCGDAAKRFGNLDDQTKRNVAGFAGLAAAAGPVGGLMNSINGVIKKGAGSLKASAKSNIELQTALKKLGSGASEAEGAVVTLTTAEKLSAGASGVMSNAMGLLKGALPIAALTLFVGAVGLAVDAYGKWKAEQDLINDANQKASDIVSEHAGKVDELGNVYSNLEPDVDGALESLKSVNQEFANSLDDVSKNSALLDIYVGTIEDLAGKSNLTAVEQEKLTQAVEGYNDITGSSVEVTDKINGKLSEGTDKIIDNANAWKKNAEIQAYASAAQSYLKEYAKQQIEVSKSQAQVKDSSKELKDAQEKLDIAQKNAYASGVEWTDECTAAKAAVDEAQQKYDKAKDSLDKVSKTMKTAGDNADYASTMAAVLGSSLDQHVKDTIKSLPPEMLGIGADIANNLAEGINNGAVTVDAASKFIVDSTNAINGMPSGMKDTGAAVANQLAAGISAGKVDVSQAMSLLKSSADSIKSLPPEFQPYGQQLAQNLAQGVSNGSINVSTAMSTMSAMSKMSVGDLVTWFSQQGIQIPESLAQSIANGSVDVSTASGALGDSARSGLADLTTAGTEAGNGVTTGLSGALNTGIANTEAAAKANSDAAKAKLDELKAYAPQAGTDTGSGFASSLSAQSGNSGAAGKSVSNSAASGMDAAKDKAKSSGEGTGGAFSTGVSSKSDKANSAGKKLANNAKSGATSWDSKTSGSHLSKNFASGIEAGLGWVSSAAKKVADAAKSFFGFSAPDKGPWSGAERGGIRSGMHLAQNFAAGMRLGIDDVERASRAVAYAASLDTYAGKVSSALPGGGSYSNVNESKVVTYNISVDGRTVQANPETKDAVQTLVKSAARFYNMK